MKLSGRRPAPNPQSGFTLVEVLVAAVIFAGVFLLLFTILGRVLSSAGGADQLRAAAIADLRLARFYAGCNYQDIPEQVELDGIRYQALVTTAAEEQRTMIRLVIWRESTGDTLAIMYGIRYAEND